MAQCKVISNPDSIWPPFCPSVPAAYLFAGLFLGTTIGHFIQMFVHRKPYSWVIFASGVLQTAAYIFRVLSIKSPANSNWYTEWFTLMMVAPIFTNAYAYMVMGRMVYNFTPTASVFKVKAWRFGLIFVLLDVFAFLVQVAGALVASQPHKPKMALLGIHIYMGGIGFQQLCIFLFLGSAVRFHLKLRQQLPSRDRSTGLLLLYVLYAVVLLITVRIIFRLIEYANGFKSTIPMHEAYQYVLDSTLMWIASLLFNIFHPGRLMPGRESNLPSRKERKALKKEGKQPQGRLREEYLLPEYENVSRDLSRKSLPVDHEPTQGHYARFSTPSPPRVNFFGGQPETLSAPLASRDASFDYPYSHEGQRQAV